MAVHSWTRHADAQVRRHNTNRQKVFWPEEGYTKGDLLDYYRDTAPVMLPGLHRASNL
jgi:DNA primase